MVFSSTEMHTHIHTFILPARVISVSKIASERRFMLLDQLLLSVKWTEQRSEFIPPSVIFCTNMYKAHPYVVNFEWHQC